MTDPQNRTTFEWQGNPNYPKPDYLSSSRKRLAPQLIYKGGIFNEWRKKTAVVLNKGFFDTLPNFPEVEKDEADIAWLVYDLKHDKNENRYILERHKSVYTKFSESLRKVTITEAGNVDDFLGTLQKKIDTKLNRRNSPITHRINSPF